MFGYIVLAALIGQSLAAANSKSLLPDKSVCGHQIVNSTDEPRDVAKDGEFPWIALLKYEGEDPFRCVGALISNKYVLTSLECIKLKHNLVSVILGAYELEKKDHVVEYGIQDKIPHEKYDIEKDKYNHDIALLRLNETVTFTDYIKPICLPLGGTRLAKPNDILTLSGWATRVGKVITTKKVVLRRLISNIECEMAYKRYNITITENHMCTDPLRDHEAFTCVEDGGSPVMFSHQNQWQLEGIVSFGFYCGQQFVDVYTNIPKYVNWITEHMRE